MIITASAALVGLHRNELSLDSSITEDGVVYLVLIDHLRGAVHHVGCYNQPYVDPAVLTLQRMLRQDRDRLHSAERTESDD